MPTVALVGTFQCGSLTVSLERRLSDLQPHPSVDNHDSKSSVDGDEIDDLLCAWHSLSRRMALW